MLEVGIIICLAVALFLVLRHYSRDEGIKPSQTNETEEEGENMANFWDRFGRSKKDKGSSIEEEILRGQESIVSPAEINKAQRGFAEADPEVAHILMKSQDAFEQDDLKTAEELAIEAIGKEKKCAQAYVILGNIAYLRNAFGDAKEAYRAALKCNAEMAEAYLGLGRVNLKDENYTDALDNLQTAVNMDRNNAAWLVELGKAYTEVRQFAKAAKSFKRAASLDMDNKEYKILASTAEDKQRMHSKAYLGKK